MDLSVSDLSIHPLPPVATSALVPQNKLLQERIEFKIREKLLLKVQQKAIDWLIVNQQRVDANWDPSNVVMEWFRLYFLCEYNNDCGTGTGHGASSDQHGITSATSTMPIPVKNSVHLAKHERYGLSRFTEFIDLYGPYVLVMLRILKRCLTGAAMTAPAAALADGGFKNIIDGVKLISESIMGAVDMAISLLEMKLDGTAVADGLATTVTDDLVTTITNDLATTVVEGLAATVSNGQEDNTMFENLAVLEGADLRRLVTLRSNDQDKVLGNLYRNITQREHVKWVCFNHNREIHDSAAVHRVEETVEMVGGTYDQHRGCVAVRLESVMQARQFYVTLSSTRAIQEPELTLDWNTPSIGLWGVK
ncbi:hypothetical protein BG015_001144 [Linnemannia schmuckeri]|uniref:Uncharacterized protein n=1 Tax=Linnemannia schmuckeri TaxID=64567 RepID=A0A9P5VDW9_9FUNG|nr:hypothetical protein BG015_001144 [Linnemannia schmuckeri]